MIREKIKKMFMVMSVVVMSAVLVAGCGGSSESSSGSSSGKADTEKATKVIIGTQEMPNDEGIAKAKDYFKEEMGVDVEIKQFDSGKDVNTALASGSIDFGLLGSCPASLSISQNLGVKCIWIHEVLGPVESLAARKQTGITDVKSLKGKTVATPFASTAHFSLLHALGEAGLSESDVNLLDMQPSEIYAAWQNGQIDAAYIWEPTLSQLKDATILCTSEDMAKTGYMTSNVELVRTDFADKNPDIVKGYIRAVSKAVDMYKYDAESAIGVISDKLQLSKEDAKSQMSGSVWLTAKEQTGEDYFGTSDKKGALAKNLYDTASFLKEQGSISEVPDMSVFEDAVDPSYIEAAAGE